MQRKLTLMLLFIFHLSYGQLSYTIIDQESRAAISYVNIWFQNQSFGTTANEEGKFSLNTNTPDSLVFSAVGYEKLKIKTSDLLSVVELSAKPEMLDEVKVIKKHNSKFTTVDDFKKRDLASGYACRFDYPWIAAKYFPYKKEFVETPFIEKIKIAIDSKINNAKFNIRLYSVGENGGPANLIIDENLITYCKRNSQILEVDISQLNVLIPKNGFFIGMEWLIVPENMSSIEMTDEKTKKKSILELCEPTLKALKRIDEIGWRYLNGDWNKINNTNDIMLHVPAIAVILSD